MQTEKHSDTLFCMLNAQINIITLGVCDLEKSRSFYQKLGWKETDMSNEHIAFFQLSGQVLALFSKEALSKDTTVPIGTGGFTLALNLPSKKEVDGAMAFAENCGAKIVKPPQDVFWGGYSGYFSDPDGFLWELAWNPFLETQTTHGGNSQ